MNFKILVFRSSAIVLGGTLAAIFCASALAQSAPSQPKVDMTGLWLRFISEHGTGAYGENIPLPELKPEIIKENEQAASRAEQTIFHDLNDHEGCTEGGNFPLMMPSSPPLNIVQSKDEVLIGTESGRARFIYTDGRPHQDIHSPAYKATGFGDSVGHWEGDVLVVDTIGWPQRMCGGRAPYLETPGGGRALPSTHLVERFQLSPDNKILTITFTWDDPTVFVKPHTYSYHYKYLDGASPLESEDSQRDAAYQDRLRTSAIAPKQQ